MNTYQKLMPNVFLAKCTEKHSTGDIIEISSKRGDMKNHVVFNLFAEKNGFFYYSIVREDGYNAQKKAENKAEKYNSWASSAMKKSNQSFENSNKGRDFLSLGEPIKVGHHSERRHRKLLESNWNSMRKCIDFQDKATQHTNKAEYWEARKDIINLSMPESIEFYKYEYEKALEYHIKMKKGEIKREHSYSLTYASNKLKEMKNKYEISIKLWGV